VATNDLNMPVVDMWSEEMELVEHRSRVFRVSNFKGQHLPSTQMYISMYPGRNI
jgi:hypothetical protein